MEENQSRQLRILILIAAMLCAVIIGYNAFYVPEASFSEPSVTADGGVSTGLASPDSGRNKKKLNINTATASELSAGLTGVGDTLAGRIVAYRKAHGPFRSIDQIKNVSGIGEKKYEEIRGRITVG